MMNTRHFAASVEQKEIDLVHLVYHYLLALCQANESTQIKIDESLNLKAFTFLSGKKVKSKENRKQFGLTVKMLFCNLNK